jgi:hypothetical protein
MYARHKDVPSVIGRPVGYLIQDDGCVLHRWDAGF